MKNSKLGNYGGASAIVAALIVSGAASLPTPAHGEDSDADAANVRRGFEIAPVPLNLRGRDRDLVGLGSYLVNAVASCGPP